MLVEVCLKPQGTVLTYIMASTALEIFIAEFVLLGTSLKHPLCCAHGKILIPKENKFLSSNDGG